MTINTNYGEGFSPFFYMSKAFASNSPFIIVLAIFIVKYILGLLVTRTGFEPMLTA